MLPRKRVTLWMLEVKKSLRTIIKGSLAPKRTLLARFWMTLVISNKPRRTLVFSIGACNKPSASGATMAGQRKRKKMNPPTAVNFASGKRSPTACDRYQQTSLKELGTFEADSVIVSKKT